MVIDINTLKAYFQKLPANFISPAALICLLQNHSTTQLKPWQLFCEHVDLMEIFDIYYREMLEIYPDKIFIPLALADDLSGCFNWGYPLLAYFDGQDLSGDPRIYYHDYGRKVFTRSFNAEEELEQIGITFVEWLKKSLEEADAFRGEKAEIDLE